MKKQTPASLESLPNIGKVTARKLKQIGIMTADDFLQRDPYEVFSQLLTEVDSTLCRCALAGLVGAKLGCPWHTVTKKSAAEFQKRHPDFRWKSGC